LCRSASSSLVPHAIARLELLYNGPFDSLVGQVAADISSVSPEKQVVPHALEIADAWISRKGTAHWPTSRSATPLPRTTRMTGSIWGRDPRYPDLPVPDNRSPVFPGLPGADLSDMRNIIEEARIILPARTAAHRPARQQVHRRSGPDMA
jgi:hypothetical protein